MRGRGRERASNSCAQAARGGRERGVGQRASPSGRRGRWGGWAGERPRAESDAGPECGAESARPLCRAKSCCAGPDAPWRVLSWAEEAKRVRPTLRFAFLK